MDGASKFVRGDAIAGLVITAINIIGGLIIGIVQQGMPIAEAAKIYTILTVGDGLVSQIPALLVSTAAGIVVSRTGKETDLGKDIIHQIVINPKSLITASGVLFVLGLIPGLPHLPFLLLSAISGGLVYFLYKSDREDSAVKEEVIESQQEEPKIESFLEVDPLTLEIGYALIPFVDDQSGELLKKIKAIRRQLAKELGFIVPPIHIKDNLQLRPNEYSFLIRGINVAKNEVMTGHWLAVATKGTEKIDGIPTKEPAFELPAYWIEEKNIEKAQAAGYMVVDSPNVIATHLTEIIRSHAWDILKRTEVQNLLDIVSKTYPKLLDELIPSHMTLGGVQRVLQNLLRERVPINDLVTILETLLDYSPSVKDIDMLTEYARQALSRYISRQYMTQDGNIHVMSLAPEFEMKITHAVESGEAINPNIIRKLVKSIEEVILTNRLKSVQPIVLCSVQVRRFLRKIVEKFIPSVVVLSHAEIHLSANLYTIGMVKYED
jgi:flagellar biosynthesis protein FlhA